MMFGGLNLKFHDVTIRSLQKLKCRYPFLSRVLYFVLSLIHMSDHMSNDTAVLLAVGFAALYLTEVSPPGIDKELLHCLLIRVLIRMHIKHMLIQYQPNLS